MTTDAAPLPTEAATHQGDALAAEPMVRVEGVTCRYPGRTALDSVTFDVWPGEVFGLLGPNGSGKSTLMRVLAGLRRPTAGRARVANHDTGADAAAVRHHLGVAFQSPSLDNKLTVAENMRCQGYLYGLAGRRLRERTERLLFRFGVADRAGERVERLSGGLKRRVELAKALLHQPRVLLLDEPSTGLDPAARRDFWDSLEALREQEGLTAIVATHLMDEAERCARVALLNRGSLVALDRPSALRRELGGETISVETDDPGGLAEQARRRLGLQVTLVGGEVRLEGEDGWAAARRLMDAFPDAVRAVRVGHPTLEDVFLARTGHRLSERDQEDGS